MFTLPKSERLHGKSKISALMSRGRWGFTSGGLKYCFLKDTSSSSDEEANNIIVSVPKRLFKRAVKRNLLKRRLREAYRTRRTSCLLKDIQYCSFIIQRMYWNIQLCGSRSARSFKNSRDMKPSGNIPVWRQWVRKVCIAPFLALIWFYRTCIGPYIPKTCRFEPSCSTYAIEAFKKWGPVKGLFLTVWRILRCNPWGGSGYDPVP